jgi:glucokinase
MSDGGEARTGAADKKWIVGVDLGGTNIVVGVLPLDGGGGEVLALRERVDGCAARREVRGGPDHRPDPGGRWTRCRRRHGGTRDDFAGVGIGSPGPLDRATGTVINTPNLGWRNFPLRDLISNAVGCRGAGQRRELRDVRRVVAGRGPRREYAGRG